MNLDKDIIENTIGSFELAIKSNFPIELDVVLSKDGEVIVFHDYDLNRLTGSNRLINNCTANELRDVKLLGTNSLIPSIDEVLHKINGKVPILIEIKESFHPCLLYTSPSPRDQRGSGVPGGG